MRTAGYAPSVRHAPPQPAPQALHTVDPVPPLGPTDAPAHLSFLLEEGIGAHNVGAFIDALRQAPQQVHTLRAHARTPPPILR
jgi:hypothetical protein